MKICIGLTLAAVSLAGCQSSDSTSGQHPAYQTVARDAGRDPEAARSENEKAINLINSGNWAGAEASLKRALAADVMYGPAHNNLGKVYYRQEKLYLAAWEFEYAAKLMPRQAEPKNNMGLVYEAARKWDDAVEAYDAALALEPENVEVLGNAARARIRRGDSGPEVRTMLQKLIHLDTRPEWIDWARRRLAAMPTTAPATQAD